MLHSLVVEHSPRLVEDLAKLGKSHRNPPKCLSREQLAPIFFVNWDNHGFMSYGATILGNRDLSVVFGPHRIKPVGHLSVRLLFWFPHELSNPTKISTTVLFIKYFVWTPLSLVQELSLQLQLSEVLDQLLPKNVRKQTRMDFYRNLVIRSS